MDPVDTISDIKRTPLFECHRSLGARFVPFAGWEMPVVYSGVIGEHLAVRSSCGLFDVSHMGEIEVSGPGAAGFVQRITTNDIARASDGQCQYTLICYPDGGVVDDCVVYRFGPERFLFCVNASNASKVLEWMRRTLDALGPSSAGVKVDDLSRSYCQVALQGPASVKVLKPLMRSDPGSIRRYHFVTAPIAGLDAIVSRTGYTGEDGFEIYADPDSAVRLWEALMGSGRGFGIVPVGLGARDTLRLEMGYPLYGHELSAETTPIEAGLGRFVSFDKGDFIGRAALERQVRQGAAKTLIGFRMNGPGIPRQGYPMRLSGLDAGSVTSGTMSPSLGAGIGMGYVRAPFDGPEVDIIIRNRAARAAVLKPPFYRKNLKAS
jgi:aminomethyltransferase